ncbi:MAG: EAL domain-containing protein [Rhodoferax sp.]|nr:EAL domain-containing protein [Rhodoferax sp.]MCF8208168.1 EAL domain-containing protein [Rhodoferax sp.]
MSSPTLDRVLDAVFRVDADFCIKFVSDQGRKWLGKAASDPLPVSFLSLLHPDNVAGFKATVQAEPESFTCDLRLVKYPGDCWVNIRGYQLPIVHQYVLCVLDISAWRAGDSAFRHAAEHDDLTGLPNRVLLRKEIENHIQHGPGTFAVALMDLDGFKKVNDTYGHAIGDAVLIETAKRLLKSKNDEDVIARLGGDEFVLLFKSKDAVSAKEAASNVLLAIARPYDTAPHNAYLGVSIGIAEYPAQGDSYSALLKNADTAMYHAKNAGKNRISIFSTSDDSEDFSIKAAIHNGIQEGEFYLEYQPQFDIERNVIGAEALMRWSSRSFGKVAPDKFIPIAEEAGLMPFLGKWALRYACHQLKKFQRAMPDFVMSVNVSPVQFAGEAFDGLVLDAVAETGVNPKTLVLEITESTLMHSQVKTERALASLRERGIRFSIDDFGTGFSSLAYLTRLPVSSIKIDKAFIRAIQYQDRASPADKKLVTAMINLAHSIDLKVVAEGVENEEQFAFLKGSGCNLIQGYLLGRPMSAAAVMGLLQPLRVLDHA